MASKENLLRWYKVQIRIKMTPENKFWLHWEKNKLFIKRLKNIVWHI